MFDVKLISDQNTVISDKKVCLPLYNPREINLYNKK